MALLTYDTTGNKLGPFGFVELTNEQTQQGPPEYLVDKAEAIVRPGISGVGVRRRGLAPDPFVMISGLDVANSAAAKTLLQLYNTAANQGSMELYYDGVSWGYYSVLSVKLHSLKGISGGAGGFLGASARAYLMARWELVQVG